MPDPIDIGEAYVGGEARFYYNTGDYATPVWVEIINCEDLDIPDSRTKVAAPIRAQWPFVGKLSGSREISLAWSGLKTRGTADTVTTAMLGFYDSGDKVEFAVADGDIDVADTKYHRIQAIVTKADEGQPINDRVKISFEADFSVKSTHKPTRATTA